MGYHERIVKLSEQLRFLTGPEGWEERFVIYPGETPWWEIKESKERHKVSHTQYMRNYCLTQVGTPKGLKGRQSLYALHKRQKPGACELCGNNKLLGYHHWINQYPSAGLWVCFQCNVFAEVVDIGGQSLASKYIGYKEWLDTRYADGELTRLAKIAKHYRQVFTMVNGVYSSHRAWGKRDKPEDNICELCGNVKCKVYHHWDDSILGKGLWICHRCDSFAEQIDTYGLSLAEKYLLLKVQDELRVFELIGVSSISDGAVEVGQNA